MERMIKPGGTIRINGEEYQAVGDVEFYRKRGESSTRFQLSGLQRLSDGQRFFLGALDDMRQEPELFIEAPGVVPAQADWEATGDARQWRVTDKAFQSIPNGQYRVWRSRGRRAGATAGLAPPLTGARALLTLAPAGAEDQPPRFLFGRELLKDSGDQGYYTDDTPASAVQKNEEARTSPPPPAVRWLSYLVVLVVAGLVALDPKAGAHPTFDLVKLYWYLGLGSIVALFLRKRYPFRLSFYIIATAFLLYFQTLFIEYLLGITQTNTAWNVEGFRIAGLLVLLVVLDIAHPKSFSMIAHAALLSGLISLFLYSCGFAIYACHGAPWSSYRQHVGGLPHGYIWLLVFVGFLIYRIRDYRLVPVKFEGALALHRKMEKGLDGTLAVVHKRAAALSHMADDFSDSLMVSNDPRLSMAYLTYGRYQGLSAMMKGFAQVKVESLADPELAEQDLGTLRDDLRAMRENIERADPDENLPGFRLSPHILAGTRTRSRKV